MIVEIPRRGNTPIFIEVKELDPTKIEVIKKVDVHSIYIPKPTMIKKPYNNKLGKGFEKPMLDRDWAIAPLPHILTDKEIGYLLADAMITNELVRSERRGWATDLVNDILKGND